MPKNVVILGCGRSGTSIFGELFEALPEYTYLSEPEFGELLENNSQPPLAVKVPRQSEDYVAPIGLSFPIETLVKAWSEEPIFFWQVRHPLDAIASLKAGISNNWGHHPRPPDWKEWRQRPLLEQCAHHWATINGPGYNAVKEITTVAEFEKLLAEPLAFATSICQAVQQDIERVQPQLKQWAERVQNTNNEKFVEAKTSRRYSRPDHSVRVGRWRENLSPAEVEAIWPLVADAAAQFGYCAE